MTQENEKKQSMAIEKMTAKELRAEIYRQSKEIIALRSCIENTVSSLIDQGILNKGDELGSQHIDSFIEKTSRDVCQNSGNANITNNYFIVIGSHNYQAGGDINLSSYDG